MKTQITITAVNHSCMPDHADCHDVVCGMTLREALRSLRLIGRDNYGRTGALTADLSDGTFLCVLLQPASDGWVLLSSQRIERMQYTDNGEQIIRTYKW